MDTRESSNGLTAPNAPQSDADLCCLIRTFASSAPEPPTGGRTYVSAATFASQQRPFRPPDVLRCCASSELCRAEQSQPGERGARFRCVGVGLVADLVPQRARVMMYQVKCQQKEFIVEASVQGRAGRTPLHSLRQTSRCSLATQLCAAALSSAGGWCLEKGRCCSTARAECIVRVWPGW